MRKPLFLSLVMLSACSATGGPYPSLQPRAAEAIDPRVPIERPINERPVSPALAAQLAALVGEARNGNDAFDAIASQAEQLVTSAGAPQSETWIAAQQSLSAAIAARKETAEALADVDAISASALQAHGGIAPNDLAAIQSAAAEVAALDREQAARIRAIQQQLGL